MPKIRAAIFDLDGTLIDAFTGYLAAYNTALKKSGIRQTNPAEFGRLYGMIDYDITRDILIVRKVKPEPRVIKRIIDDKRVAFFSKGYRAMRILPGVREILKELRRRRIKLALATSAQPSVLRRVNLKLRLDVFKKKVTGPDIQRHGLRGKPHPDEFLVAAKRLGVRPRECVVFEDSLYGVRAGRSAGMRVVAVATGKISAARLRKERPFIVAKNMREALRRLDKILQ